MERALEKCTWRGEQGRDKGKKEDMERAWTGERRKRERDVQKGRRKEAKWVKGRGLWHIQKKRKRGERETR